MIVLVTGATAGFGEATVKRFAKDGAKVIGAGRRTDRLEQLQQEVGPAFLGMTFDVSKRQEVDHALSTLPVEFAAIDILINNAGLALGLDPAQSANLDDWETMVDTNIKGLLYVTRKVLPGMVERNRGHIVNLGSVAAEFPYPGGHVYGGTKAFVHQFSYNLRADLAGTKVRVTDIQPGMCGGTEFSEIRFKGDKKRADSVYEGTEPLTADDVADTIHWVATRPAHVNINVVQMMPVCQSWGPLKVVREQ